MQLSAISWSLWPAVLLTSYFLVGLVVYTFRYAIRGAWRDENIESRPTTAILSLWIRLYFAWIIRPVFAALRLLQIPADAITTLSTIMATGSAIALAAGHITLGGWLLLSAGTCDFLDGRLARIRNESTKSGAALDSILDRYSDAIVLSGLAWFYRDTWVLLPILGLIISGMMVSYTRARGEGLGVEVKGGLAQRAERLVTLGIALVFSLPVQNLWFAHEARPMYWLTVGTVILLMVLSSGTALYRLAKVHNALGGRIFQNTNGTGKGSLLRHTVSAIVATGLDFVAVLAIVSMLGAPAWLATALGCAVGAVTNFSLNRVWTFGSKGNAGVQSWRYVLVSASSALLNAGGVALFMLHPELDYRIAWVFARVLIFLAWNYPLQKTWVFDDRQTPAQEPL